MESIYREYVLSEVHRHTDSVEIAFQGHEGFGFILSKNWLEEHSVNSENLIPGQHVHIQGKEGNEPAHLWGADRFIYLVVIPL